MLSFGAIFVMDMSQLVLFSNISSAVVPLQGRQFEISAMFGMERLMNAEYADDLRGFALAISVFKMSRVDS